MLGISPEFLDDVLTQERTVLQNSLMRRLTPPEQIQFSAPQMGDVKHGDSGGGPGWGSRETPPKASSTPQPCADGPNPPEFTPNARTGTLLVFDLNKYTVWRGGVYFLNGDTFLYIGIATAILCGNLRW